MTTPVKVMLSPSDPHAPNFEGEALKLYQFLADYEAHATAARLTEEDKVKRIVAYVSNGVAEDIEQYTEFEPAAGAANVWDHFKTRFLRDYPDAKETKLFYKKDYEEWLAKAREQFVDSPDQLHALVREHRRFTTKLVKDGVLAEESVVVDFVSVLAPSFGPTFAVQLQFLELTKQQASQPTPAATTAATMLTFDDIRDTALKILQDKAKQTISSVFDTFSFLGAPSAQAIRRSEKAETVVKIESSDMETRLLRMERDQARLEKDLAQERAANATLRASLTASRQPSSSDSLSRTQAPSARIQEVSSAPAWDQHPPLKCYFCDGSHSMNSCEEVPKAMSAGLIKKHEGYIVLPSGDRVPRAYPNEPLKAAVERYHQANPGQKRRDEASTVQIHSFFYDARPAATGIPSCGDTSLVQSNRTPARSKDATSRAGLPIRIPATDPRTADPRVVQGAPRIPAFAARPQYKDHSPTKHHSAVQRVAQAFLDKTRISLDTRNFFAVAPELQQELRTQEAPPDVLAGATNLAESTVRSRATAVADIGLRFLDVRIGAHVANGLLDTGSEMCVVSEAFAHELGLSIELDETANVVTANGSRSQTLGVIRNVQAIVGGLSFYLTMHVVAGSPVSLLLGRPFYAIASANEAYAFDGSSVITLTDPNGGRSVRMATKARIPKACAPITPSVDIRQNNHGGLQFDEHHAHFGSGNQQ